MGDVVATAERTVPAPPEAVFAFLCDYGRRPEILPDQFTEYRVLEGGGGAGTLITYRFQAGRANRVYRLRAEQPDGETRLLERDLDSSFRTEWSVAPAAGGSASVVSVTSRWTRAGGIAGVFEGLFAPAGLRAIYARLLAGMDAAVTAP